MYILFRAILDIMSPQVSLIIVSYNVILFIIAFLLLRIVLLPFGYKISGF